MEEEWPSRPIPPSTCPTSLMGEWLLAAGAAARTGSDNGCRRFELPLPCEDESMPVCAIVTRRSPKCGAVAARALASKGARREGDEPLARCFCDAGSGVTGETGPLCLDGEVLTPSSMLFVQDGLVPLRLGDEAFAAGCTSTQGCWSILAAVARFDVSNSSIGSRNEASDEAASGAILYLSDSTECTSQNLSLRMLRSSPLRLKSSSEYLPLKATFFGSRPRSS